MGEVEPTRILFFDEADPSYLIRAAESQSELDVSLSVQLMIDGSIFVRRDIPYRCKICGEQLGYYDAGVYNFRWPAKAEHYILAHGVWVSELTDLLNAIKTDTRLCASLMYKLKKASLSNVVKRPEL